MLTTDASIDISQNRVKIKIHSFQRTTPASSGRNRSMIPTPSAKVVDIVCGSGYKVRGTSRQTRDTFCVDNMVGWVQKRLPVAWRYPEGEFSSQPCGQFSQVDSLIDGTRVLVHFFPPQQKITSTWRPSIIVNHFHLKLWSCVFKIS